MTDDDRRQADGTPCGETAGGATRSAVVRTTHADAELVAAALAPDNTAEMRTAVADATIETVIERDSTGGLRSSVDDYVVNLSVADRVLERAREHGHDGSDHEQEDEHERGRKCGREREQEDDDEPNQTYE